MFLQYSDHHNNFKKTCEGEYENLLFVCNARFIYPILRMVKDGVALNEVSKGGWCEAR